ncbi:BRISC complex subunit FAM175B [Dendroctonus ponderosae]|uniref:BRISC complex subunit FAM175B n=1 Tax=Dendroctonus ponderosae TaxID=77166 RepID=UPI0020353AA8|nr:BRISC complex subunit FAM175B [Dendroctonus ponderosae]KAH1015501.1 hypothetical protein HUJ05_013215 [Dendroctonus ponderosae]KAH1015502.1 hypothetical protein HUJ05_013215 [Dendroctonus ponderosae]
MFQPASVSLSGSALSFLLFETSKATVRQIGFFLGDIIHKEITCITDNEQQQVDISKIIKIDSVIPCATNSYFRRGRVDKEKVRKLLGSNFSRVVAWYKYEPSSALKFTWKDRALHKQFREMFHVPHDLFSICFLLMETTDIFSSYNYQQHFIRYYNGKFDKLSMYIPNLSESNNTYRNSEPPSEVFNKILSSIKMDIDHTKGVVAVTEIENAVLNFINSTTSELIPAEKYLFEIENEIFNLKNDLNDVTTDPLESKTDVRKEENNESEETLAVTICKSESSHEATRHSPRRRNRTGISLDKSQSDVDANKNENVVKCDIPSPLEATKKSVNTKAKGKGTNKKKC